MQRQFSRAIDLLPISGPVTWLPLTGSTNQLALEAAQAGARRGIWVADEQTAGRGRGGHSWHSRRGDGLYVSVLVTPELPLDRALWLSLATGLAAQQAILSTTGIRIDLRWPNDLLCGERKLGGILVETSVANAATRASASLRYARHWRGNQRTSRVFSGRNCIARDFAPAGGCRRSKPAGAADSALAGAGSRIGRARPRVRRCKHGREHSQSFRESLFMGAGQTGRRFLRTAGTPGLLRVWTAVVFFL